MEYKKNNKCYFIPNKKEAIEDITGEELFAWLIYKGDKFPLTKHKYKLKEGDIIKMGRVWLIVRGIHVPEKVLERRNTNCLISYHSQMNESLNINSDFKEDQQYAKLIESNSNVNENEEEEEEEEDGKSKKKEKKKASNNKNTQKDNINNKILKKVKKSKKNIILDIKKKLERLNSFSTKKDKDKDKKKLCRICYMSETNSVSDPLIKPCKCSGSMKYIHLKCLIHWLKTKIQVDKSEYVDNEYFTIYSSEKVECELCKEIFPHFVRHKNQLYNLLELDDPENDELNQKKKVNVNYTDGDNIKKYKDLKDFQRKDNHDTENYIVFDTIPVDKTVPSYIYVAKFNKEKKLKIGRGLDMNLIMNDLSVSRNHCQLELCDNGDILLQDNNSKFGTLILIQAKEIEILRGQTLTIQVGRTYFHINYKSDNSLFKCCQADVVERKETYENMNYKAVKLDQNANILTESSSEGSEVENEEESKNTENVNENAYDNNVKKINNKKVNIMKIIKLKKKLGNETDRIIKVKEANTLDDNNNDNGNDNNIDIYNDIKQKMEEQEKKKEKEKEEEEKKKEELRQKQKKADNKEKKEDENKNKDYSNLNINKELENLENDDDKVDIIDSDEDDQK